MLVAKTVDGKLSELYYRGKDGKDHKIKISANSRLTSDKYFGTVECTVYIDKIE